MRRLQGRWPAGVMMDRVVILSRQGVTPTHQKINISKTADSIKQIKKNLFIFI
jgi:hypothetical protein